MSYRRRLRHPNAGHDGDWLLTYADTITLLLCLFVVLLASQAHGPGRKPDLVPAVPAEQPVVPNNIADWKPSQPITPGTKAQDDDGSAGSEDRTPPSSWQDSLLPTPAHGALPPTEPTITAEPPYPLSADSPVRSPDIPQPVPPPAIPADAASQQASNSPPMPLSEIAAHLTPEGAARLEQEGDRITTVTFDSAAFFSRGAATLNTSGKGILREVVGNLKSEEYRDYMVTIEGHTDDAPINTAQFPSNWELSTARAGAVVRFFVEQGVPAQRLRAAGYADTHPLQPNRDGNGTAIPGNQAKNRRVVIELQKIEHH